MDFDVPKIGFWPLLSLVIGSQIGSGVFLLPASLAPLGPMSLLGWGVTGTGAILLALVFAQLCTASPLASGPPAYVQMAFGKTIAFYTAWVYWLVSWISTPVLLSTIIGSLVPLTGHLSPCSALAIEALILLCVTWLNLRGLRAAGWSEVILSGIKLFPLLLLPLWGLFYLDLNLLYVPHASAGGMASAINGSALLTLWGFIGVEAATAPAQDVRNPSKTIPGALIAGTSVVVLVYVLNTFVIMGLIPSSVLAQTSSPYAMAASKLWGNTWDVTLGLTIAFVCLGTLNAWILISGGIAKGAAASGLLPPFFKRVNRNGAPIWGIVLSSAGVFSILVLLANRGLLHSVNTVIDLSVTAFLLVYALCVAAYLRLLSIRVITPSPLKWLLGISASLFCIWALYAAGWETVGIVALIPLSGILIKKLGD